MSEGQGVQRHCGCGDVIVFSLQITATMDGDPRIYTSGQLTHPQWRGHPAGRVVYRQGFKVLGRFPNNVLEVADAMEETLRFLLRKTGCFPHGSQKGRGGWES